MKKPFLVAALITLLLIGLLVPLIRPVQAASAGCTGVGALSGDYPANGSSGFGPSEFFAGDEIDLYVSIDGPSDLRLQIQGPQSYDVTSGNPQQYIIPETGSYSVTVTNTLTQEILGVVVACTPSGVVVTEDPSAQTATQEFLQTQYAISTMVAETQIAQTQAAAATQTEIANQATQTAITGQTQTAEYTPPPTSTHTPSLTPSLTPTATNTPPPIPPTNTHTPAPPTNTDTPLPTNTETPLPWPGFTDGRINPSIDEAFTLYCQNNFLVVYRTLNGVTERIVNYPISGLGALAVGSTITITTGFGPLSLNRLSDAAFSVSGTFGNNAPALGIKSFLLAQCIERNGGLLVPTFTRTPSPTLNLTRTVTATPAPLITGSIVTNLFALPPLTSENDSDGDGIRNVFDLCPTVYAPNLAFGCPDSDGDGLSNPIDRCPLEAGVPGSLIGCPDYDGDGFISLTDLCPFYAPPPDAGMAHGCADRDFDGYPNAFVNGTVLDWCPMRGLIDGVPHFMGCPDLDGDGLVPDGPLVPDAFVDICPEHPLPPLGNVCQTIAWTPVYISYTPQFFIDVAVVSAQSNHSNTLNAAPTASPRTCSRAEIMAGDPSCAG